MALLGLMMSSTAIANTPAEEDLPTLESIQIQVEKQGTKISTNVVTEKAKDESTATDLRGLLQAEPSIDFSGGNGTSQYLTIRGMGQNSVDVKVDNAYSDSQILYHQGRHMLDPSLVKIVAVQKGAGAASAGIGQTNGAIVAKTIDALDLLKDSDKDYGFKVNAGYASNDEYSFGATTFAKAGNFDFLLSYNKVDQSNYKAGEKKARLTDDPDNANDGQEVGYTNLVDGTNKVPYSALDKVSYLAKAGVTLGDHRFVASHFNTTNKGIRLLREEFNVLQPNNPNHQDAQYREVSIENTNLEYQGQNLGFADKVDANIYFMKNARVSADDVRSGKAGYAGGVKGKNTAKIETKGLNLNFDSQLNDDVLFKYGVNYRHQELTPNKRLKATDQICINRADPCGTKELGANVFNQEKTDTGVYAEVIGTVGDFTLTGGMRYDHFNIKAMDGKKASDGALSPSIGVIYQATPNLSFNAVHNYATRSPRLFDALMAHGERGITSVSKNIKSERAKNTEIGFNYKYDNFSVDGTYFWQRIDNLLRSVGVQGNHGIPNYSEIDNVGHATNKGYELNARYTWEGLTVHAGIADAEPKYYSTRAFNNREFGNRIGRTYTLGLAYRFDQPNVEIGTNIRKVDDTAGQSAWMTEVLNAGNGNNDLNLKKFGYHTVDVFANWKPFNNDKLNVNFGINNITDEYYRPHTHSSGLPAAGRDYRIGFNYTF